MSEPKFKPGDKFKFVGGGGECEVLTDGYTDDIGTWHLARFQNGRVGGAMTAQMVPVLRVTLNEAQFEMINDVLYAVSIGIEGRLEALEILRRDHSEQPEGEAQ